MNRWYQDSGTVKRRMKNLKKTELLLLGIWRSATSGQDKAVIEKVDCESRARLCSHDDRGEPEYVNEIGYFFK